MPCLNGSRDRFATGNDVFVRLLAGLRLAGLACRDDAFDEDVDVDVAAVLFGILDVVALDLVTTKAAVAAALPRRPLLLSLSIFKFIEIGELDTLRRFGNGVALGDEFFELVAL